MSEYFFRRYRNGERMAEDVRITQAATLEEASLAASRIAAQYRDGTVLVSECEVDLRAELAALRAQLDEVSEALEPTVCDLRRARAVYDKTKKGTNEG